MFIANVNLVPRLEKKYNHWPQRRRIPVVHQNRDILMNSFAFGSNTSFMTIPGNPVNMLKHLKHTPLSATRLYWKSQPSRGPRAFVRNISKLSSERGNAWSALRCFKSKHEVVAIHLDRTGVTDEHGPLPLRQSHSKEDGARITHSNHKILPQKSGLTEETPRFSKNKKSQSEAEMDGRTLQ